MIFFFLFSGAGAARFCRLVGCTIGFLRHNNVTKRQVIRYCACIWQIALSFPTHPLSSSLLPLSLHSYPSLSIPPPESRFLFVILGFCFPISLSSSLPGSPFHSFTPLNFSFSPFPSPPHLTTYQSRSSLPAPLLSPRSLPFFSPRPGAGPVRHISSQPALHQTPQHPPTHRYPNFPRLVPPRTIIPPRFTLSHTLRMTPPRPNSLSPVHRAPHLIPRSKIDIAFFPHSNQF